MGKIELFGGRRRQLGVSESMRQTVKIRSEQIMITGEEEGPDETMTVLFNKPGSHSNNGRMDVERLYGMIRINRKRKAKSQKNPRARSLPASLPGEAAKPNTRLLVTCLARVLPSSFAKFLPSRFTVIHWIKRIVNPRFMLPLELEQKKRTISFHFKKYAWEHQRIHP